MKERPILFDANTRWVKVAASRLGVNPELYASELNSGRKICGGCRQSLPRGSSHFGKDSKTFDGMKSRCRECVSKVKKDYYKRNRKRVRKNQLRYQESNRERLYAYNAKWQRDRNAALKQEVIEAYGGKCSCCGEDEKAFLELDHIYNDGAAERRRHGNHVQEWLFLKEHGWPNDRHQLLCANCNKGKHLNGGVCPHNQQ